MQVAVYIPKMAQLCTAEHTHKPTSQLLTSIVLNKDTHETLISYTLQTSSSTHFTPLRQTKLSTKSWHKEAPTRKSAQKKYRTGSAYVQSAYDTSEDNCPSQAYRVSTAASAWCGVAWCAAVCACMRCILLYSVWVCVHSPCVTYDTAQVKIGQNSRRAAWADLGVAPRVCAVVSISSDMTGPWTRIFFFFFQRLHYTSGPGNEVRVTVLNPIFNQEFV